MVAKLLEHNNIYYCSNFRMKQFNPCTICSFCGYTFSNWEEVAFKEVMLDVEEERRQNESNIYRRD